jgi:hypothetical protein
MTGKFRGTMVVRRIGIQAVAVGWSLTYAAIMFDHAATAISNFTNIRSSVRPYSIYVVMASRESAHTISQDCSLTQKARNQFFRDRISEAAQLEHFRLRACFVPSGCVVTADTAQAVAALPQQDQKERPDLSQPAPSKPMFVSCPTKLAIISSVQPG